MQLRSFYEEENEDYDTVLHRLAGNEPLLRKYLKKFAEDTTFSSLEAAVQNADYDAIRTTAHTLKGMSVNLGLSRIHSLSSALVDCIRAEEPQKITPIFDQLQAEYQHKISQIIDLE